MEDDSSRKFHFKASRKSTGSFKKRYQEFSKKALRLTDRHVFMRQLVEPLNVLNALTLKQIF